LCLKALHRVRRPEDVSSSLMVRVHASLATSSASSSIDIMPCKLMYDFSFSLSNLSRPPLLGKLLVLNCGSGVSGCVTVRACASLTYIHGCKPPGTANKSQSPQALGSPRQRRVCGKPATEECPRGGGQREEDEALERGAHLFIGRGNNVHKWEGGGSSSLYDLRNTFASHDDDVAWHDYESMKAKYAAHTLNAAHTLTHKSASHTLYSIERERERERGLYSIEEEDTCHMRRRMHVI
jgi:hypothetical protein